MNRGYIQLYTGNGKGKTTAALGLAIRSAGAGLKVFFAQFAKGRITSEIKALKRFADLITLRQYGCRNFICSAPTKKDFEAAAKGIRQVRKAINSHKYNVVILDEITFVIECNLIDINELLYILHTKPKDVEIVITGRNAQKELMAVADLITEMKNIRHYYTNGVLARVGIEK